MVHLTDLTNQVWRQVIRIEPHLLYSSDTSPVATRRYRDREGSCEESARKYLARSLHQPRLKGHKEPAVVERLLTIGFTTL